MTLSHVIMYSHITTHIITHHHTSSHIIPHHHTSSHIITHHPLHQHTSHHESPTHIITHALYPQHHLMLFHFDVWSFLSLPPPPPPPPLPSFESADWSDWSAVSAFCAFVMMGGPCVKSNIRTCEEERASSFFHLVAISWFYRNKMRSITTAKGDKNRERFVKYI